TLVETLDAAEHRDRRGSGSRSAARRLGRRDRSARRARAVPVPDRVLLDAAALLGARAPDQARLRGGPDPDAPGGAWRPRDRAADRLVFARPLRRHAAAVRLEDLRRRLPRSGGPARCCVPAAGVAAEARDDPSAGASAVPLLARLPRAAVRGHG